jgi:hypothetical protein
VDNGLYSVMLGDSVAIPFSVFSGTTVFIEVVASGDTLTPRQRIISVAYAMKAGSLADDSVTSAMITDGTITGTDIDAQTITGTNIALDTITGGLISNSAITGSDVGVDELGLDQIQDLYVLNTGDTVTGDLQCTADVLVGGSVGIGTLSPGNLLDVVTVPRSGVHVSARSLYVTGDLGAADNGVEFRHSNGLAGIGFGNNTIYATGSIADQDLNLIARGGGGVGIGTNSPTGQMEVYGPYMLPASTILDQEQAVMVNTSTYTFSWQSFTPGLSGVLVKVDLWFGPSAAPAQIIEIFAGEGMLGTRYVYQPVTVTPNSWNSFALNAPFQVNAGSVYTIKTQAASAIHWGCGGLSTYPGGRSSNCTVSYEDHMFRTYVFTSVLGGPGSVFVVADDGSVGVHTATPTAKLEVAGELKATGFTGVDSEVKAMTYNGSGSTYTQVARFGGVTSSGTDVTYTDSAAYGASFSINTSGVYLLYAYGEARWNESQVSSITVGKNVTSLPAWNSLNTLLKCNHYENISYTSRGFSNMVYLSAGDVVRLFTIGGCDGNILRFSIRRIR